MESFGGFGSSGFGNNNNTNANTSPFGGFNQNQTSSAFGGGNTFGSGATSGGNLFGNNANTNTTQSAFRGFGNNNTTTNNNSANNTSAPFGANKPAFGATSTSGSLFGGSTATSNSTFGSGGFGATSGGFGSTANTGFGASTGGGLFGGAGGGSSTITFAPSAGTTTPAFGSTNSPFTTNQQNTGTGNTPYTAFTEKEGNTASTNQYQSICAMPAYQKFSTEELRVTDYAQGRKFSNASGQPGAFGANSGFGGFGANNTNTTGFGSTANTGGGIFGNSPNNPSSTPFGGGASNTTAFGSANTGGGLFASKPATGGGLFGNTNTTSAPATGGLFGGTSGGSAFGNTTNTGFGGSNTNTAFGTSQNKPLFGASSNTATAFGNTTTPSTGGLFGGGTASGGFGNSQPNNPSTSFGAGFGAQNNQQQQQNQQSGGNFGAFGNANNQQKPGPLFGGSTNTGGGLFANNQNQQQQTGGLFGNNTAQQSTGLFGAAKPATGGLFGSTAGNTGGGGLFGNTTQQQNTGPGLFGAANNTSSTGLFGNKPAAPAGGLGTGLFGASTNQAPNTGGTSLFGNSQQPQQAGLQGSMFGSTMQASAQQSQQNHLVASLNDNPYGNAQLFQSLQTPTQSLGPIATPLSSTQKARKQAIIPHYRVVPHASSRLITPQRRPQAYGFSYSNYNSPLSPASNVSPLGNSLFGASSIGRSLGKSLSTSNLRHSFTAQESILAPGAFSSQSRSGPGSMKKLNINRNLGPRRSLFSTESPTVHKRVSFDTSATPNAGNFSMSGALQSPNAQSNGAGDAAASPTTETHGAANGASSSLALTVVPENSPSPETQALETRNRKARLLREDQTPGNYSTEPSIESIAKMSREERAHVRNFTVRREGVGQIVFSEADLTNTPLEEICGKIVELSTRQATVYGDRSTRKTPPQGHGLNVRSIITLENSWPRARSGKLKVPERNSAAFEKHIRILKACKDTRFVSYDEVTGSWSFQVEHYTTYGHIYDDDDSVMTTTISHESESPADIKDSATHEPETVTPEIQQIGSDTSSQSSGVEDTFDFKKGKRKQVPGQFDDVALEDAEYYNDDMEDTTGALSFDEPREIVMAVGTAEDLEDDPYDQPLDDMDEWQAAESASGIADPPTNVPESPAQHMNPTPQKTKQLFLGADWTEHLQQTISPVKRDRQTVQNVEHESKTAATASKKSDNDSSKHVTFGSTMDIMKSLFGQSDSQEKVQSHEAPSIRESQNPSSIKKRDYNDQRSPLVDLHVSPTRSQDRKRFKKFSGPRVLTPDTIIIQRAHTEFSKQPKSASPFAHTKQDITLAEFANAASTDTMANQHEQAAWQLAAVLFDSVAIPSVNSHEVSSVTSRARKDQLSEFWSKVVQQDVETAVQFAKSSEEKALMYLTGGNIIEACSALLSGANFHLAQLVSQLPGDKTFRQTVATQIEAWQGREDWSEMNDSVRAIYEILAGEVCEVHGVSNTSPENKASSFTLSYRFKLDWKRSFGLRLWFGTLELDDIAEAVVEYAKDLADRRERATPSPWFISSSEDMGWNDPDPQNREDILWGLLKLYADQATGNKGQLVPDVGKVFEPENVTGDPIDARLSFQLLNALQAATSGSFSQKLSTEVSDNLAITYATALDSQIQSQPDLMFTACWTLLHISNATVRTKQVHELLDKHANLLDPDSIDAQALTSQEHDGLHIPYAWICSSRAKYAETVEHDYIAQARWLIEGGEAEKAHEVFCHKIGPDAIISLDYNPMREILGSLEASKVAKKVDWDKGAGLYLDFIELVDLEKSAAGSADRRRRVKELVKVMAKGLSALASEVAGDAMDKTEKIALKLMAEHVAETGRRENVLENEGLLKLPLTESGYLKQSMALSMSFYQDLMLKA